MPWATASEVKTAIGYPTTGAPVDDATISSFILDAQDEVEKLLHNKFGNVETSGTATSGLVGSLTKTGAGWTIDAYSDMIVWIYEGTGLGQYRSIVSNTADTLTITPNFSTPPDATSKFRVLTLGYRNDAVDGNGSTEQFADYHPLLSMISLTIDSIAVSDSKVYKYITGKLALASGAEIATFKANLPQLVVMKYVYGVYPMPRMVKRLCILLAGMRALSAQLGGQYGIYNSINLPHLSGTKGDPTTKIKTALDNLQAEADRILRLAYIPWTQFG